MCSARVLPVRSNYPVISESLATLHLNWLIIRECTEFWLFFLKDFSQLSNCKKTGQGLGMLRYLSVYAFSHRGGNL